MKKLMALFAVLFVLLSFNSQGQGILNKIKDKVKQRADDKEDKTIDKGLDKTEDATKKKDGTSKTDKSSSANTDTDTSNTASADGSATAGLKVYSNYDFVPGDKVIFEDNFTDDQDGEFPSHWELERGQAILNKLNGIEAFYLTDGNYCVVSPLIKNKSYLTDPFTIEYDVYDPDNAYGMMVFLKDAAGETRANIQVSTGEASVDVPDHISLSGTLPAPILYDKYKKHWHHIAIAYKNKQIKMYVDQYRVLVVPNTGIMPAAVTFGGIGNQTNPIIMKNVRIAAGGDMNMIGKKFTEAKIVTHGINFDIDKAAIKPESMGTLNMIVQVLKDNPDVKFEIDGHTDNTGSAPHNLTLSQQRADAVKAQLVTMGIDVARLSAKGFGDTQPISDNNTLEGKANNRRVEFVKMP